MIYSFINQPYYTPINSQFQYYPTSGILALLQQTGGSLRLIIVSFIRHLFVIIYIVYNYHNIPKIKWKNMAEKNLIKKFIYMEDFGLFTNSIGKLFINNSPSKNIMSRNKSVAMAADKHLYR